MQLKRRNIVSKIFIDIIIFAFGGLHSINIAQPLIVINQATTQQISVNPAL